MKVGALFWVLVLFFSCSVKVEKQVHELSTAKKLLHKIDTTNVFIDSLSIAKARKYKVWLASVVIDDTIPKIFLRFFVKRHHEWRLTSVFEGEHWAGPDFYPAITDFNYDGYNDLLFKKGNGARGSNAIQNLFIFSEKGDSLFYIKNSNDYPNLSLNTETKTINSYILTGGNETVFLSLKDDMLFPKASIVQYGKDITVTKYDTNGKENIILVDTSGRFEEFAQFSNYKPLKVMDR
jgi:hypothetical protein